MRVDQYLRREAWQFILSMGIKSLPVDSFGLARRLGYILMDYEDYASKRKWPVQTVFDRYGGDGFCFLGRRTRKYYIVINRHHSGEIKRWTVMHEISHIVLGHISTVCPEMSRIRSTYRDIFEVEAQGFARRVLCPSIVLFDCGALTAGEIASLCGISQTASVFREGYIKTLAGRNKFGSMPEERMIRAQFRDFVRDYLRKKIKTASKAA